MRRLVTLTAIVAFVGAFTFATAPAIAGGKSGGKKQGFGRLDVPIALPLDGWLIHHYDNRTGQVTDGPDFDDSAEVIFEGTIIGIGLATVEQSAAWTFNSYALDGGPPPPLPNPAAPCALAYTSDNPRTLVRIHTHAGVSTENVTAPLTVIPGAEFPFSAAGVGSDVLDVDTNTFTGTVKITDGDSDEINGNIKGGTNCEVKIFPFDEPLHTAPPWEANHSDTINTVTTVFEIVSGTGKFDEASGDGVLVFTYDTDEPHTLLHAHIALNLE